MKTKLTSTLILLTLLATSVFSADFTYKNKLIAEAIAETEEITPEKLHDMLENEEKVIVLDIREIDQRAEGRIDTLDKYELTRGQLEFKIMFLVEDKNTPIVAYCRNGPRSILAAQTLKHLGYKNVTSLKGGLKGWTKAGYPIKTGLGLMVPSEDDF